MSEWLLQCHVSVESWLDSLSREQLKSVAKELLLLELSGSLLRLPHSRSLGSGLFELRERRFGFRVYYGFAGERKIVLLQAGDKSTQERDILKARAYLKEVTR